MNIQAELKGLSDVRRKLEGRIRRLEQSMLRKGLQAFGEPMLARAQSMARSELPPKVGAKLKIVMKVRTRGQTGFVLVGPSADDFEVDASGRRRSHGNIGYWFEKGYNILEKPYHSKKGAPVHKYIGAHPFLSNTWDMQKDPSLEIFEQVMRDALEQEVET